MSPEDRTQNPFARRALWFRLPPPAPIRNLVAFLLSVSLSKKTVSPALNRLISLARRSFEQTERGFMLRRALSLIALLTCFAFRVSIVLGRRRSRRLRLQTTRKGLWSCCADGKFNRGAKRNDWGTKFRRLDLRPKAGIRPRFPTPWFGTLVDDQDVSPIRRWVQISGISGNELFRPRRFRKSGYAGWQSVQMFVVVAERICIARHILRRKTSSFIFPGSTTAQCVVQRAENCRCAGRCRHLPIFEFDLTNMRSQARKM